MDLSSEVIWMIVVAFLIAFILAVGVGANDVANAFGTSVGSKVLTLRQACIIATLVETLGAILLGSKVTDTLRKGIIDVSMYDNQTEVLMLGNIATLSGSCIWLILATVFKMPVSGTHSVVGASLGFSFVAMGTQGVKWKKIIFIISSWFISPILSGIVSCALFYLCKFGILTKSDPLDPGLRFLPIFYGATFVVNVFSIFYEGPSTLYFNRIPLWGVIIISFGSGIVVAFFVRSIIVPWQRQQILNNLAAMNEQEKLMMRDLKDLRKKDLERINAANRDDVFAITTNPKGTMSSRPSFAAPQQEREKKTRFQFTPSSSDNLNNGALFQNPVKRERSQSMIASFNKNDSAKKQDKKRIRSKSESATSEAYSDSIKELIHKRFVPADKSMILNIEKRFATDKEKEFKHQGLGAQQSALMTRELIDDRPEQRQLFAYLQILSAAFGGFAHGGNDVSNAIGPLVSIWVVGSVTGWTSKDNTPAPIWILFFGGLGITIGLWVWGRRVIRTMGEDLAKITPSTGFCIELGAATTVLAASNMGLPISTTHCKVGSVVTVGWARARKNVDWKLFSSIFLAWVLTLPVAGGISAALMALLLKLPFVRNPDYDIFAASNSTIS